MDDFDVFFSERLGETPIEQAAVEDDFMTAQTEPLSSTHISQTLGQIQSGPELSAPVQESHEYMSLLERLLVEAQERQMLDGLEGTSAPVMLPGPRSKQTFTPGPWSTGARANVPEELWKAKEPPKAESPTPAGSLPQTPSVDTGKQEEQWSALDGDADGVTTEVGGLDGVDMEYMEGGEGRRVLAEETKRLLHEGGTFKKHGRMGEPHERDVHVEWTPRGGGVVVWSAPGKSAKKGSRMGLDEVLWCAPGRITSVFDRSVDRGMARAARYCFSLVGKRRSLDLEAKSQRERDMWVKAFKEAIQSLQHTYMGAPRTLFNGREEVFIDAEERVLMHYATGSVTPRVSISGKIVVRLCLSGSKPVLTLGCNDMVGAKIRGKSLKDAVRLANIQFHPCVDMEKFKNTRNITFSHPNGDLLLMNYEVRDGRAPLMLKFSRTGSVCRLDLEVRRTANWRFLERVRLTVPPPKGTDLLENVHVSRGKWREDPDSDGCITWNVGQLEGTTATLTFTTRRTISGESAWHPVRPLDISYEISAFVPSSLRIRFLKVVGANSTSPSKWVRYTSYGSTVTFDK